MILAGAHVPVGPADVSDVLHALQAGGLVEAGKDDVGVLLPQRHPEAVDLRRSRRRV